MCQKATSVTPDDSPEREPARAVRPQGGRRPGEPSILLLFGVQWDPDGSAMATPGQGRVERRLAAVLADGMRRREFIALLGGAALAWPLGAHAQQPERVRRVGVLTGLSEDDPETKIRVKAFREGLRELGLR